MASTSDEQRVALVRVSPILTSVGLVSIIGLCSWWAVFMITHENDGGYFMTRTAEGRWVMASLGIAAATVATFSLATQVVTKFVWALGTGEGIHAAVRPTRGLPPLRVPGPAAEVSLTSTPLRWGRSHLVIENGGLRWELVVLRSNAQRARRAFDDWVDTTNGQDEHDS